MKEKSIYTLFYLMALPIAVQISGCASDIAAPIESRSVGDSSSPQKTKTTAGELGRNVVVIDGPGSVATADGGTLQMQWYSVREGETVRSVSSTYGLEYKDVLAWNNIQNPDEVKPGHRLRLPRSAIQSSVIESRPLGQEEGITISKELPSTTTDAVDEGVGTSLATENLKTRPKGGKVTYSDLAYAQLLDGASISDIKPDKAVSVVPTNTAPPSLKAPVDENGFIWPTRGKIIKGFHPVSNKGIDIEGAHLTPVVAASSGKVVFTGRAKDLGTLLILKHPNNLLTAYAHLDKTLVKEGNVVRQGQKIAEMGSSATTSYRLHFEVRESGTPMDPLSYLPPQSQLLPVPKTK